MLLFQKKKLNLREMHKLYLLLKPCLPEQEEPYLLDEIDKMLDRMTEETLKQSLSIVYEKELKKEATGIEALTLFVRALKNNMFFEYVRFVKGMNVK